MLYVVLICLRESRWISRIDQLDVGGDEARTDHVAADALSEQQQQPQLFFPSPNCARSLFLPLPTLLPSSKAMVLDSASRAALLAL